MWDIVKSDAALFGLRKKASSQVVFRARQLMFIDYPELKAKRIKAVIIATVLVIAAEVLLYAGVGSGVGVPISLFALWCMWATYHSEQQEAPYIRPYLAKARCEYEAK